MTREQINSIHRIQKAVLDLREAGLWHTAKTLDDLVKKAMYKAMYKEKS
jgi:hypothetical protein